MRANSWHVKSTVISAPEPLGTSRSPQKITRSRPAKLRHMQPEPGGGFVQCVPLVQSTDLWAARRRAHQVVAQAPVDRQISSQQCTYRERKDTVRMPAKM
jgi:hypothetical protein